MLPRVVVLAAALVMTACGGGQTPTSPTPQPPPVGALTITCPTGVVGSTTGTAAAVSFPAPTTAGGLAPVTVTCSPFSGATFPIGTTTVACQATDARNTAAACSFPVVVSRIPTLRLTRFLAFGDSVTAGEVTMPVPTSAGGRLDWLRPQVIVPSASYPHQLRLLLAGRYVAQVDRLEVATSAVSGEWAEDGRFRFPGVVSSVRPEVVLLMQGYNDIAALGTGGIPGAIAALDSMAREAGGRGARVFLASLAPPRAGGRISLNPAAVQEFNSRLRGVAAREGAVFVDVHAALSPAVTTYIGVDGLHPTEAGYRRIAEEFLLAIRTALENP